MTILSSWSEAVTGTPNTFENADRNRRILLVEDERELCITLGDRLGSEGYVVDFAHDGRTGLAMAGRELFDLIILDLMLPKENGLDVCLELRRSGLSTPVLILTARCQVVEKVAGLKAGADDYMTKPFDAQELIARIEALLRRSIALESASRPEGQYQFGPVTLDILRQKVTLNGLVVSLTSREFHLLLYLAEHSGQTISREELLECVWGDISGNVTRTVDMHIATLRQKLEANPRSPELVLTDPGAGYRFQP